MHSWSKVIFLRPPFSESELIPLSKLGIEPDHKVIKLFSCSTQLSTKFILLISVKMPTIVGILTFISMINTKSERLTQDTSLFVCILVFMSS